jgi:lipopolysaccharide/colanic/teichoic acid biosynthesis glycosyltransferase
MRLLDVSVSLVALVVLSPLLAVIAIVVKISSDGPAVYRGRRVGKDGRLFEIYKFRTMVVGAENCGPGVTCRDDPRVTRVGRVLRRTKLDELPQFVNTLRGDMSLVGPRPEDPRYVASYSPEQRKVLTVKPGLTSAATLLHRHEQQMLAGVDWERTYVNEVLPAKLQVELHYLSRRNLPSDLRILLQTTLALLGTPRQPDADRG